MAHRKTVDLAKAIDDDYKDRELPRKKERLDFCAFRLSRSHIKLLRRHFENQGISLSTGLRTIAIEYIKKERIK